MYENKQGFWCRLALLLTVALSLALPAVAGDKVTYYHNDALGSPVAASNGVGQVIWREGYRPYGQRTIKSAASASNRVWFTGKQEEEALGISYFGARWYHPELGRFLTIDPVGVTPGNPHIFNRYAYANNNPYGYIDPDGRLPIVPILFFVAKEVAGEAFEQATGLPAPTVKGLGKAALKSLSREGAEKIVKGAGRAGKQDRLRELAGDSKLGSADRGWIKQEINSIERGQQKNIRNPPGKDLAHERGREAAKGYGYGHSNLQDRDLHRLQHKYDNFGKKNKERPPQ